MKICVIGGGYVGLPTAACLAENGNEVLCIEKDETKLALLREGRSPVFEPGLQELLDKNFEAGRLHFARDLSESRGFALYLIAVGTPPLPDGNADLRFVVEAAREVCAQLESDAILVIKSTVPVGTTKMVARLVREELKRLGKAWNLPLAFNPEFLKQGKAVKDTITPDRIIIGCDSPDVANVLRRLYKPFSRAQEKIIVMDSASAEMTKYAANAMLATRISFMNEMSALCDAFGADIEAVRRGIGTDSRIGKAFLYAGLGFGGSCFPKDLDALIGIAEGSGIDPVILKAVKHRNYEQRQRFLAAVVKHFGGQLAGLTLSIWGLSYKPETDDIRESPALFVCERLLELGANLQAYDPAASSHAERALKGKKFAGRMRICKNPYEALKQSRALLLLTEWKEFTTPDFARIKAEMETPLIFDGRNQFEAAELEALGFQYRSVGRPARSDSI